MRARGVDGRGGIGRFVAEQLAAEGKPHGLAYAETFRVISFRRS